MPPRKRARSSPGSSSSSSSAAADAAPLVELDGGEPLPPKLVSLWKANQLCDTTIKMSADGSSFAPAIHANTGQVSLSVDGAGFAPGLSIKLVAENGTEYLASEVEVVGASSAYAELDLEGMAPGLYTVIAELGAASAQGSESFEITEATGVEPEVEVSLVVPSEVGRHARVRHLAPGQRPYMLVGLDHAMPMKAVDDRVLPALSRAHENRLNPTLL